MNNYANALSTIANTKNLSLRNVLTPEEFLSLRNALLALRFPAYKAWKVRFDNASNAEKVTVDLAPVYAVLKPLCEKLGDVNGAPLHAENLVELCLEEAHYIHKIDVTPEMAHKHYLRKEAMRHYNENPTEENATALATLKDECKILENTPGNCKDSHEPKKEEAFIRDISRKLGNIINKQQAKSAEQVQAEEAERKEAMKARAKARKEAAKKAKAAK